LSFDLDNLLGLLFFVVFILLPIVSRSRKRQQQRPKDGRTATGAPTGPTQGRASTRSVPLPGQAAASADRGSSATITLEEIRRRVEEAQRRELQSRQGSQSSTSSQAFAPSAPAAKPVRRGLVASDPFEQTLVGGAAPAGMGREGPAGEAGTPYQSVLGREGYAIEPTQARPSILGRQGARTSGSTRAPGLRGRGGTDRTARAAAAAIGEADDPRQLGGPGTSSKLSPTGLLRFDRRSILQGMIWHEILGDPPSSKRPRRTRSRLR